MDITSYCPNCGLLYRDFRTGYSFSEVRATFWRAENDPTVWHPKRRHSVLGRWHELKKELWAEHIANCIKTELIEFKSVEY